MKLQWLYILLSVAGGPKHGSAIREEVAAVSNKRVTLWPATLYGSLATLTKFGWLEEVEDGNLTARTGGRPRFYRMTSAGRDVLREELAHFITVTEELRERLSGPADAPPS